MQLGMHSLLTQQKITIEKNIPPAQQRKLQTHILADSITNFQLMKSTKPKVTGLTAEEVQPKGNIFIIILNNYNRTYIYKLLYINNVLNTNISPYRVHYEDNSWVIDDKNFDYSKFEEACRLFQGYHCMKHFCKLNLKEIDKYGYWRTIDSIKIINREPDLYLGHIDNDHFSSFGSHKLIMVEIKSKSFLWNQIRIIMQNIVDYSLNKVTKQQICDLLTGQDEMLDKYPNYQKTRAPPQGLYLANIKYNQDDLIINKN